jgi:hypothetical protein
MIERHPEKSTRASVLDTPHLVAPGSDNYNALFTPKGEYDTRDDAPLEALRTAFFVEQYEGDLAESEDVRAFLAEYQSSEVFDVLLQKFLNTPGDAHDHDVLGTVADAVTEIDEFNVATKADTASIVALGRKLHALHASRGLPQEQFYTFLRVSMMVYEAFIQRLLRARRIHNKGGNAGFRGTAFLQQRLAHAVFKIGDEYPPPAQADFMRRGVERGDVVAPLAEDMKRQFLERWEKTSGYSSIEAFRTDLEKAPRAVRMIAKKLRSGDFYLTANVRSEDLPKIQKEGLKSIYEVGEGTYSRGTGNTRQYDTNRFRNEARLLGLQALSDMHSIPAADRLKYFAIDGGSPRSIRNKRSKDQYGDAVVAIHADDVEGRAFLTVGDSLNSNAGADQKWDNAPIPLEYADVLAPFIYDALVRQKKIPLLFSSEIHSILKYDTGPFNNLLPELPEPFKNKLEVTVPYKDESGGRGLGLSFDYVEAQVLGPVPPNLFRIVHAGLTEDESGED